MKFVHHVSVDAHKPLLELLTSADIQWEEVTQFSIVFDVDEDNTSWKKIETQLACLKYRDMVSTRFSRAELSRAITLSMISNWHQGYPMPDSGFAYRQQTYDLTQHCLNCGIGAEQNRPFKFRGEPRWGKRHILQKHWVYDVFFVLPEVYEQCFKPLNIASWPVLDHRTGRELTTVVQLKPNTILKPSDRIPELFHSVQCAKCGAKADCGRKKFRGTGRGMFPYVDMPQECHMALTTEWLGGEGGSASRGVIVSAEFYRVFMEHKLSGARFEPVEDAPSRDD